MSPFSHQAALAGNVLRRIASRLWRTTSFAVFVLLVLVYLAEVAAGGAGDPVRLCAFGANSFPLVQDGELFRLATANVLHSGLFHLFVDAALLIGLGIPLESLLGGGRFLCLLLVSALAGSAGSAFLGHHVLAVGASPGIAGLIGAQVALLLRWRHRLPDSRSATWLVLAFYLASLPEDNPNVDNMGHLTGLLAGFAFVFLETRAADPSELANLRRGVLRITAALLVALFLAAGGFAVWRAGEAGSGVKIASCLLRDTSVSPAMQNALVRHMATDPDAAPPDLTAALQRIESAIQKEPGTTAFRDTRAAVLYRLGRWREAIQAEYDLSEAQRLPLRLSQLACLEWASSRARGPLVLGQPPVALPHARLDSGGSILVDLGDRSLLSGAILHLVLATGGKPSALVELRTGASETSFRYSPPRDFLSSWPDAVSLTLLDTRKPEGPRNETRWDYQPIVSEAACLP